MYCQLKGIYLLLGEFIKIVAEGKAVIGTKEVLKGLKQNTIEKVFISLNCPVQVTKDLQHYAGIASAEVVALKQPNDELGIVCRKQFSISVVGLKRE